MTSEQAWVTFGVAGQLVFMARFVVQWISSEKAGRSVMPTSFWFLSICGSLMLMAYALYRRDPVFIIGQSTGMFIYVRNIQLILRERASQVGQLTAVFPDEESSANEESLLQQPQERLRLRTESGAGAGSGRRAA